MYHWPEQLVVARIYFVLVDACTWSLLFCSWRQNDQEQEMHPHLLYIFGKCTGKTSNSRRDSTCCMGKPTASSFNPPTFPSLYFKIRPGDVYVVLLVEAVELLVEAVELLVEPVESPLEAVESLLEFVHLLAVTLRLTRRTHRVTRRTRRVIRKTKSCCITVTPYYGFTTAKPAM